MSYDREEFVKKLGVVEPGLASKDLVVELTAAWFMDNGTVHAYNDIIGIEAPLKSEFKGGVNGGLLLGLLSRSDAKDIVLDAKGSDLIIKAGALKATLPLSPPDSALFSMPGLNQDLSAILDKQFIAAIRLLLLSVGQDTTVPDQLGVTCIPNGQSIDLYSTDSSTISWYGVPMPAGQWCSERIVIPSAFCEQLLRLYEGDEDRISIETDSALVETKSGVRLFSRLVEVPSPVDFAGKVNHYLNEAFTNNSFLIPAAFKPALERVMVLLGDTPLEPITLAIRKGVLHIDAKVPSGHLEDQMPVGETPDASCSVEPSLILRVLDSVQRMHVSEECVVLTSEPKDEVEPVFVHLIATR